MRLSGAVGDTPPQPISNHLCYVKGDLDREFVDSSQSWARSSPFFILAISGRREAVMFESESLLNSLRNGKST
jgi:hypothetical protein